MQSGDEMELKCKLGRECISIIDEDWAGGETVRQYIFSISLISLFFWNTILHLKPLPCVCVIYVCLMCVLLKAAQSYGWEGTPSANWAKMHFDQRRRLGAGVSL